jgi:hypothetical protein
MREHPEAFDEAKRYEKSAIEHGSPFTWTANESLDELSRPERVSEIERQHEQRRAQARARRMPNLLRARLADAGIDEALEEDESGCLVCHK